MSKTATPFLRNPLWPSSDDAGAAEALEEFRCSFPKIVLNEVADLPSDVEEPCVPPPGQTEKYHAFSEAAVLCGEASVIVSGKRVGDHGEKERSFDGIARMWTAYIDARPGGDAPLTAVDVCYMMQLMKMMRSQYGNRALRDHHVDNIGYAAIAGELAL